MTDATIVSRGPSPFVPGFELFDVKIPNGLTLRVASGGKEGKTPLLMVHGHPHNHVIWRKVAPTLARDRRVILVDLRGYGDSSKPESTPDHRPYSKRVMAEAVKWGRRDARINSISPGIIVTPLALDEFNGPRGDFYKRMFAQCPTKRPGTADEVANVAELLMSGRGAFITGADFLIRRRRDCILLLRTAGSATDKKSVMVEMITLF